MIPLGNGLVNGGAIFDLVALQHSDLAEMIREHSSRHQSRHAAGDNQCMAAQMSHGSAPSSLVPTGMAPYAPQADDESREKPSRPMMSSFSIRICPPPQLAPAADGFSSAAAC